VPGFNKLDERRATFQNMVKQLQFADNGKVKKAVIGKGAFMMGDDLEALLDAVKVRREIVHEAGLQFIRRRNTDGYTYFLNNRTDKAFNGWVPLSAKAASVALFDPMFAKSGLAKSRQRQNGAVEVYVQLQPFESAIVQTFNAKKTGGTFPYATPSGDAQEIKGSWTIEFVSGGPKLPAKITTDKLGSWTKLDGDDVKNFSGTAKYSVAFAKPSGNATAWLLDLGHVDETAEVFLNGKKLATLIGPEFKVEIPAASLQANNKLEVLVSNLMANRIIYMDKNGMQWKKFYNINMSARKRENVKNGLFDASGWEPQDSGLSGPVTLTPISRNVQL
jgi:hypothetical protein